MLLLFHVLQPDLLIPTPETSTRVLSNATNRYFTPLNVVVKATSKKGNYAHTLYFIGRFEFPGPRPFR